MRRENRAKEARDQVGKETRGFRRDDAFPITRRGKGMRAGKRRRRRQHTLASLLSLAPAALDERELDCEGARDGGRGVCGNKEAEADERRLMRMGREECVSVREKGKTG